MEPRHVAPPVALSHHGAVRWLAHCGDSRPVVSACARRLIIRTAAGALDFDLPFDDTTAIAIDAGGAHALVGSDHGEAVLLALASGETSALRALDSSVAACAFTGHAHVAVAAQSGALDVYPLGDEPGDVWRIDLGLRPICMGGGKDASRIIIGGADGEVLVVDVQLRQFVMGLKYRMENRAVLHYRGPWQLGARGRSRSARTGGVLWPSLPFRLRFPTTPGSSTARRCSHWNPTRVRIRHHARRDTPHR